ncbi:MAG TPA: lipopolysaccharide heptosyltransferase II [Bacteroidota bacterium]|nr:lipopolysaccharide heptosyltransferase II [Bacteroidota bacterium]
MPSFNKILIIRFSSLGDILLITPLLRAVRSRFPSARIDVLVKQTYGDLLRFHPAVGTLLELPPGGRRELGAMIRRVRGERYDLVLDLHNSLRSIAVRLLSGCRRRGVVSKHAVARWILVRWKKNYYRRIIPVAERYLRAAERFGVQGDDRGLEIYLPGEVTSSVRVRLEKYRLDKYETVIGFAPTARHFTKRWPQARFVEAGILLASAGRVKILVFGGKDETEYCADVVHLINSAVNAPAAENCALDFTLMETAAVLDRCDAVLTNDSGLMHLAAARKRKIVALFGSTVAEFGFFPYGTKAVVLEKKPLSCRPCTPIGRDECPLGHFSCMNDIQARDVVAALKSLLPVPKK